MKSIPGPAKTDLPQQESHPVSRNTSLAVSGGKGLKMQHMFACWSVLVLALSAPSLCGPLQPAYPGGDRSRQKADGRRQTAHGSGEQGARPLSPQPSALSPQPQSDAAWQAQITEDAALVIRHHGAPVVRAGYVFWGPKWKYAGARMQVTQAGAASTLFTGFVADLGIRIQGVISRPAPDRLVFTYRLEADRKLDQIIGGGLEFTLNRDSPSFEQKASDPVLLENKKGWKWTPAPGQAISVSFSEPLANGYFEQGDRGRIRALFVGNQVSPGARSLTMTVQLPPGGQVVPSLAERYGPVETSKWHVDAMAWNASPVDLSSLNEKPAGKRGFVRAKGDELVFGDGTPARFWGGNLAAYALFASKEEIQEQSRRIARMGYNLMRLHHHDSTAWVSPTVIDKKRADSRELDAEGLDRIDWWIRCLKEEGVYIWLDLHVGRQFKAGDAVGKGFEEIQRAGSEAKGFSYFNTRVQELMREFNTRYLSHINPYTKLAYKDEPAVMGLLITNENDLTHHFGNLMLGDKGNPVHNALFTDAVRKFAAGAGLPVDRTGRTWEPGPSKIFLNEQEHRFNQAMLAHLRALGVKVPVATTNYWGASGLYSLPALADGDVIDVHSYGEAEALGVNPRYEANYISWIGAGQVYGKPLTITEWNVEYPTVDRFTAPLYLMSIASLQGWDAPMIYNYSQRGFGKPDRADKWSTFYDPALSGLMPAAAVAFRQGHVAPARDTYCLQLSRDQLYMSDLNPRTSAAVRTLVEQSKLTLGLPDIPELDWDRATAPAGDVKTVTDPNRDFIPKGQSFVQSDTGELKRDWTQGFQTIDTPKTQAASGWIGGRRVELKDVTLTLATGKATVAVTSLDNTPIAASKRLLVSVMARVLPSPGEQMPYHSEPVKGILTIRSRTPGMKLVPLKPDGTEHPPVPFRSGGQGYTFTLPAEWGTHWFLLKT
jgi:hypothetical protein